MPCNCDHLEATAHERESKRVCALLSHFMSEPPQWVVDAGGDYYGLTYRGEGHDVHEATALLCDLCNTLDEAVIYDGKDPMARKLADWWDAHKEADEKRRMTEEVAAERERQRKSGLSKLTPGEAKALGH